MAEIIKFPTKEIKTWNLLEKKIRKIMEEEDAPEKVIDTVIDRMKSAYKEYYFSYQLPYSDSETFSDEFINNIKSLNKALEEYFVKIMSSRILLEIKLAFVQWREGIHIK